MRPFRTLLVTLAVCVGFTAVCCGYAQIMVETRENQKLYINSPSQILPSTQITFLLDSLCYPEASPDNPVIIQIHINQGTKAYTEVLSQTLATGNLQTTSPLPSDGEVVFPLAVVPFRRVGGDWVPDDDAPAPGAGPDAVQMFRYVAGESEIWIRLNETTEFWPTGLEEKLWGFTVALGGGVWPPNANSNWGAAGRHRQQSTLLVADLREHYFPPYIDYFSFWVASVYQTGGFTPTYFYPTSFMAFNATTLETMEMPAMSVVGTELTDTAVADLNKDGYDDFCSVDQYRRRLYWCFGVADGTFGTLDWLYLPDFEPVRVDVADINGDSWFDFFITDSDGVVHIYDWWDIFGEKARADKTAAPVFAFKAAAVPGDSALHDLNGDGASDYLVTDQANNTLNVYIGSDFGSQQVYPTGAQPVGMAVGDFNGDTAPDVATANQSGDSITVFRNTGGGALTGQHYAANGKAPVDIDAGDFDRDGRTDLVVAYKDNSTKSISLWKAQADGTFVPGSAQKIFFTSNPSAVMAENIDAQHGADAIVGFANYSKLAVCVSDAAGTLTHAYNLDTLADVVVDPVTGVVMSEDSILSVAGGTAAGGISSRDGVAAIASQGFNVIHFPRSKDISFSLVNLGTASALVNFELFDDAGTVKSYTTQSVAPLTQFPRYFGDLLGPDTANASRWVRAFLTSPETYGIWLLNNGLDMTYLDGGKIQSVTDAMSAFVLPMVDVAGGHYTQVYLENPYQNQAHVTVRRHNAAGVQQASHAVLLNKRGRVTLDLAAIFPGIADTDYLMVQSDLAIIAGEIFGDAQTVSVLQPFPVGVDQGTLYSGHLAHGDFGGGFAYETWLTLVNTSDTGAMVSATLYDDDGDIVDSYAHINLGARSKVVYNVGTMMGLTGAVTGYLKLDLKGLTGVVGCVTFGDATNGAFQSVLPLQAPRHNRFVMGHIANGTLDSIPFFTGLAIVNPHPLPQTIYLSAYDQDGLLLDSQVVSVQSKHRLIAMLDQVMPGLTNIFGGYLVIECSSTYRDLMVFQLFGDTDLTFLSAVPAVPIE